VGFYSELGRGLLPPSGECMGTLYYTLVACYPSSRRESVLLAVFANLHGGEVLHIVPGVLPGSIPEPSHLERAALMFVVALTDEVVEDIINRFTSP